MKPVIKVWCLPKMSEDQLRQLHAEIVAAAISVEMLGLKDENDMVCLFPSDKMSYGLGEEIIIEVRLVRRPQTSRAMMRQQQLANILGETMSKMFPEAYVECSIHLFNDDDGSWSSQP
ncbi:MAG: hypothetical protein NUV90_01790 [Candidatus Parcubacteria bacterium]|nr:hypothetical protein [Candidatus Parcubacteria bacterium]